jgi:glycosyltransferase involved in cell wall biosynthesis
MNRVLMVAFHFPPMSGSSGIQRTLRFVQQLPRFSWEPLVLSIDVRAYQRTAADLLADVPPGTVVRRAFGLDTARDLSIGRFYLGAMARPDRWVSWRFAGVREGMKMIRELRPRALWSTYPIATAHLIGAELQRRSGLPWIADFRDPMAQPGYPPDPRTWASYRRIEEQVMRQSRLNLFTTPSAAKTYAQRYPDAASRIEVLENGYDEDSFSASDPAAAAPLIEETVTLLHSGIVYPEERDPTQLIAALQRLRQAGVRAGPGGLLVRFRAPAHGALLKRLAQEHGVEDMIEVCPAVPYREALAEMLRADGLLVMQAANCNEQIPAKIYEYLRAGRPVVCLSDPAGDTVGVVRRAGIAHTARLESVDEIAALLERFLADHQARQTQAWLPQADAVAAASRLSRTECLARHLDRLA